MRTGEFEDRRHSGQRKCQKVRRAHRNPQFTYIYSQMLAVYIQSNMFIPPTKTLKDAYFSQFRTKKMSKSANFQTLGPKGPQKPSQLTYVPKCWQHISNKIHSSLTIILSSMSPVLNVACPQSCLSSKSPVLNVACPQSRLSSTLPVLKVVWPQCRVLNVVSSMSCPQCRVLNVVCPQCPIVVKLERKL